MFLPPPPARGAVPPPAAPILPGVGCADVTEEGDVHECSIARQSLRCFSSSRKPPGDFSQRFMRSAASLAAQAI